MSKWRSILQNVQYEEEGGQHFNSYDPFNIFYNIWIYENGVKELAPQAKGVDINIKRKFSPFFLPPLVYRPVIAVLSIFSPFYMAWRRP